MSQIEGQPTKNFLTYQNLVDSIKAVENHDLLPGFQICAILKPIYWRRYWVFLREDLTVLEAYILNILSNFSQRVLQSFFGVNAYWGKGNIFVMMLIMRSEMLAWIPVGMRVSRFQVTNKTRIMSISQQDHRGVLCFGLNTHTGGKNQMKATELVPLAKWTYQKQQAPQVDLQRLVLS